MTERDRDFDVVVWGATGFTGRLVAEYLLARYGVEGPLRWALGGRSREKLERVREEISGETGVSAAALPLFVGDAGDEASMRELAGAARVVCTTVGPYARYGGELVAACARAGTHYCDLTGEVQWMRRMIDTYQDEAVASGARIVQSCGFDCIPSDLGVFFLQREMRERHGVTSPRIKGRVAGFTGGASGGTIASMLNLLEEAQRDPEVRRVLDDPFGLNPKDRQSGEGERESFRPAWDPDFRQWTGPFVMGAVNTKVVRRTDALLGNAYGAGFRYDEAVLCGGGPLGFAKAAGLAAGLGAGMAAMAVGPVRRIVASRLPAPGEGPSKARREAGWWDLRMLALHPDDPSKHLHARITGDRDPGYGSTSKMLGESAVCLALDALPAEGGFFTPAAAMGEALLARLDPAAGVRFAIEEGPSGGDPR